MEVFGDRAHTMKEIAGDVLHPQAEEVAELSAGDEDGDAVGESDDNRARKIFDQSAKAGDAHDHQDDSREHCAGEQASEAVAGNDAKDDDYECTSRAADLRAGAAEGGNQETSDDGTVDACLRRDARGDGESHGERQRDKTHGDSREQVSGKFVEVVIAQKDYRFW